MKSKTFEKEMNLVVHENDDGSFVAYYDGVFGTFCKRDSREEAIAGTDALLEEAKVDAKEFGLPLVIGTDPLPDDNICCIKANFSDGFYKRAAEEAIEAGLTVNTYLEEILCGKHGYELNICEDEDAIHLMVRRTEDELLDEEEEDNDNR